VLQKLKISTFKAKDKLNSVKSTYNDLLTQNFGENTQPSYDKLTPNVYLTLGVQLKVCFCNGDSKNNIIFFTSK